MFERGGFPAIPNGIMITQAVLVLFFLFSAARLDLRDRRVPDTFWIVMAAAVFPFAAADMFFGSLSAVASDISFDAFLSSFSVAFLSSFSVVFSSLFASLFKRIFISGLCFAACFFLYRRSLIGGADMKAMVLLSLLYPEIPTLTIGGMSFPVRIFSVPHLSLLPFFNIFFIAVSINAVFLSSLWLVYCLLMNAVRRVGPPALRWYYPLIGFRMRLSDALRKKVFLAERIRFLPDGRIVRSPVPSGIDPGDENEKEYLIDLIRAADAGLIPEEQWVTPQLPLLLPIAAGVLAAFFVGDLLTVVVGGLIRFISVF